MGCGVSVLSDVRDKLAELIAASGLAGEVNVFTYEPEAPPLPAILIVPPEGTYIAYNGTFGPGRMMEINLIIRVMMPSSSSPQTAASKLDEILSSGDLESKSLTDAVSVHETMVGSAAANIHCGEAVNVGPKVLDPDSARIQVITADLPVTVRLNRSVS